VVKIFDSWGPSPIDRPGGGQWAMAGLPLGSAGVAYTTLL